MLSRKAKYGLKAMLRLAMCQGTGPMLVSDLAARESIPKKFLEQILLELKHRGLLQSKKGKGGGYMLTRPISNISMGEVIRALDGPIAPIQCVSLTAYAHCDECVDERTCGIRLVMKEVRDAMADILDHSSLADVLNAMAAASSTGTDGVAARVRPPIAPAGTGRPSIVTLPTSPSPRRPATRR